MIKIRKITAISVLFAMLMLELMPLKTEASILGSITIGSLTGLPMGEIALFREAYKKLKTMMDPTATIEKYANGPINGSDNNIQGVINKTEAPGVAVVFTTDGAGMTPGARITATATPSFFKTTSKDLYYTWYLKREGCEIKYSGVSDNDPCDLDKDHKITENDWKIAATKIIIAGSASENEVDVKGKAITSSEAPDANTKDAAGYKADKAPTCYVREPESGLDYELQEVKEKINACPSGTELACIKSDQQATCDALNPAYNIAVAQQNKVDIDAANAQNVTIIATNEDNRLWNIANPGGPARPENTPLVTVPEPYGPTSTPIGFPKSISVQTKKFCAVTDNNVFCKITDDTNLLKYKAEVDCFDGGTPACVNKNGNTVTPYGDSGEPYTSVIFTKNNLCSSLSVNPSADSMKTLYSPPGTAPNWLPWDDVPGFPGSGVPNPLYSALIGQQCSSAVAISGASGNCEFEKSGNPECSHLFAEPSRGGNDSGDGIFTLAERNFWGADPKKSSVDGAGNYESVVAGLGIEKFTWMYSKGDQVGVAVEGDSLNPTGHSDSTYKRTWAFSKNTCEALTNLTDQEIVDNSKGDTDANGKTIKKRGIYFEGAGGQDCDPNDRSKCTGFLTAQIDLNECLEENLIDPIVDSPLKLGIQLNALPENPINDPNGEGDTLTVTSSATNTDNDAALLYKWSVQKSMDGVTAPIDTTQWLDITEDMQSGEAPSVSKSDVYGLGKKTLAINLNMQEALIGKGWSSFKVNEFDKKGVFYLRLKLEIASGSVDGNQDVGGFLVVRVTEQQNKINVYPVNADEHGKLSLDKTKGVDAFCDTQACYVAKNDIVGVEIPSSTKINNKVPFTWTINNEPIVCSAEMSLACAGGNALFFPIIGNEGEIANIVAKGLSSTGEAIELSKQFLISGNELKILSTDTGNCDSQCSVSNSLCAKFLGQYFDLAGTPYPDCSKEVFEARAGSSVNLFANGGSGLSWTIDGQEESENQGQIQLAIDKSIGETYGIGLSSDGTGQTRNARLALYKNWGITQEDAVEESQSTAMQITVVADPTKAVATSNKLSFFGASLITYLPEQLMFLLKISLTSIAVFFLAGILFAVIPERVSEKDE